MAIIQVWSAPSCEAGAVCFGSLSPWVSATGSEATGTPEAFRVTVPRTVADAASLAEGRCLRVLSQSRGEQWWFVSQVADSDGDAGLVSVTAGPLRQLLTVRGLVRDGSTFAFTTGKQTVTALLTTYVLTNLADDSLSWLSLGTIDFTDTVEIGNLDRTTRAAVLDAIEGQTGQTARLRGLYTAGVLTGFALDVVADVAAGTDVVPLTTGASLATVQRTRDALRAATVVVPFGASGQAMDQTAWTVDSTSGTSPAWIVLRDVVTANPWPVQEDGQLVGAYVRQADGTQSQITDSRASNSAVQVASVGTLAAGQEVTIVRDTSARPVLELTSPAGVSGSRGRLVGTVATKVADVRRNLSRNGVLTSWTSDTVLAHWTASSARLGRYPRNLPARETTLVTDGALPTGATTITFRGGTPGARLYRGEFVNIPDAAGLSSYIASDVVLIDNTGRGSFTLMRPNGTAQSLVVNVPDGSAIGHLQFVAGGNVSTQRPTSLPADTTTDLLRFTEQDAAGAWYVESAPVQYLFTPEAPTVNVAAGVTLWSTGSWTTTTQALRATIRNLTAGTDLATAACTVPVPSGTVHETISATATMSGNASLAVRLVPGEVFIANDNIATRGFQSVRWVSLWAGSDTPTMGPQVGSGSNALWHRAQDVLASAASGTRYTVRGVDLQRLVQESGALALGQSVRLRSELLGVNTTVKIVKLDYDFTATESLSLELGSITPRLTGATVSL